MAAAMKKLQARERICRDSLLNLAHLVETYEESRDKDMLEGWKERVEALLTEFNEIRLDLELNDEFLKTLKGKLEAEAQEQSTDETIVEPESVETVNQDARASFELSYLRIKGFVMNKLRDRPRSPLPEPVYQSRVKLPEIKLPEFDGNIRNWPAFRDAFSSLIGSNPQINNVDKFSYLRSSLSAKVKRKVEGISSTADSYAVAWELLEMEYENNYLIVMSYVEALFEVDPMQQECYKDLNHLIDEFESNLKMLERVGEDTTKWSTVLVFMLSSRLDPVTLGHWENHRKLSTVVPTYADLIKFLRGQSQVLQSIDHRRSADKTRFSSKRPSSHTSKPSSAHTVVTAQKTCPFCQQLIHSPFQCEIFQKMHPNQRYEAVKRNALCLNCLASDHIVKNCSSRSCQKCSQRHHTMLHKYPTTPSNQSNEAMESPSWDTTHSSSSSPSSSTTPQQSPPLRQSLSPESQAQATAVSTPQTSHFSMPFSEAQTSGPATVLLSTALVKVFSPSGSYLWARALLDSGSQLNFVSENLSQKLKLPRTKEFVPISGVGLSATSSKHTTFIRIQSHRADFEDSWKFHVLPQLTLELPNQPVDVSKFNLPSEVILADPGFSRPSAIDLILGVEVFYDLLRDGQRKIQKGAVLQNTSLGWVVSGKAQPEKLKIAVSNLALVPTSTPIDELVSRFWEIESCNIESTLSVEETKCEEYFAKTTQRDLSGRFVVALPQKRQLISQLGNSRDIADRRFYSLERRLNANPALKKAYSAFIHEYAQMGHMKLIEDSQPNLSPSYYLPHHCIVRPDSLTTKLRVVFDASCATDNGLSLNDALVVGPVVQDDLLAHVLRFRVPRIAIVADIEKMYRQIKVRESDQPLQRIRWRESPSEPLQTYQLTTVTYGTSSAPYLATKCLQKLSEEGAESHPAAAVALARNFYMDDLLTGANSVEEGRALCKQLIDLTNAACFPLRKWASNNPTVLDDVPAPLKDERTLVNLDAAAAPIKALGLQWDTVMDELRFQVPEYNIELPITKQQVLSDIARLFDPLGLAGPVLVQAKLFMQDLWREGYGWKEPLKEFHQKEWTALRDSFRYLADLRIPRWVTSTTDVASLELHGFCDASERAYGACIYVRAVKITGEIFVKLLASKSKIAPKGRLKNGGIVNLPRLELCGALLLAHLFEKVESSLNLKARHFFWTDSEIVLHQIAANPSRWKTFVANRCAEIQRITTSGIWSHVPGIENPADVLSRGMCAEELRELMLWWNGPKWLSAPSRFWPPLGLPIGRDFTPEELEERTVSLSAQIKPPNELFALYSSFSKLVRTVTLLRRFAHNLRNADKRRFGFILPRETNETIQFLVKLAQRERFAQELLDIEREQQVKSNSRLKTLSPILHEDLLRVGGRLRHAPVSFDQRHQMILPDKHPLTELIMDHYHEKLKHAGPQLLVATVRERFWPLRAKDCARQRVHACVQCFRCKPKVLEQLMGELPQERVTPTLPFLHTGVDYCGPFSYRPTRRANVIKCYVAVFICLVTKAVHLECVADLTTKAFIAALKRFVARRGKPNLIECDNALNFQGAQRELEELAQLLQSQQHQDQVTKSCTEDDITFKFIPPRTPNFGGLWEAAVKSMKNHMRRTVGNVILYLDDFLTILTQIEGCLNSRPLTQLSSDPSDLEVLTPGHFLVHRSLTAIPEPSLDGIPANRLDKWQQNQEYVRKIWQQWQTDYLSGLQPRTRWTRQRNNVDIGTMVLVREDNLPPLKWRIGRVTEIFKGSDGNIRVVLVRTKDGEYRRGISRICVLPNQIKESDSEDTQEGN